MKKLLLALLCFLAVKCFAQPFTLWGMTNQGGTNGAGVLFEYNPLTGAYTNKVNFDGNNGSSPYGSLIKAANGKLYGMTNQGGANGAGVLFEFNPATSVYTKKMDFDGNTGSNPLGSMTEATNGKLYGMTNSGGANGQGVLFEYDPSTNVYTKKVEFDGINGGAPFGNLVQATNGKLYGMTNQGGTNNLGVVFEYNPATDTYNRVQDFDGNNGSYPQGSMIQASNGNLYGLVTQGGANNFGVLFEYDLSSGIYSTKIEFDGTNGANPNSGLIQASNGLLYGVTSQGGDNWIGVLFEFNTATDAYTVKKQFSYGEGYYPYGDLVQAPDGKLYGMTNQGGSNYIGSLFEYDLALNFFTKKVDLDGLNGQYPFYSGMTTVVSDKVYVPDNNFEAYLEANGMGDGIANNDYASYANIAAVATLDVSGKNIADLTGIEYFEALQVLNCSNNNLKSLKTSRLTNLQTLNCSNNSLSTLNISSNAVLISLICNNNLLTSLDVSNANNTNFTGFDATINPSLYCIKVDDPAYSSANWTQKDSQTGFGDGCIENITLMRNIPIDPISTPVSGTTFSINPALPAGLSMNTSTGVISGTPSVASTETAYTITIDGTNTAIIAITVKDLADIPAKYVQFRATYSSDASQVNIYELLVYSNGENVAYHKKVSSNSYEYGDECSNGASAVDGNLGSRYSSNRNSPQTSISDPVLFTVELSQTQSYNIESIFVNTNSWSEDYKLYISDDNIHWTKYGEATHSTGFWPSTPSYSYTGTDPSPFIASSSPAEGQAGTVVVITGTGFDNIYNVAFGGVPASSFIVNSSTQITATVAAATPGGNVAISVSDKCNNYISTSSPSAFKMLRGKIYVNAAASGAGNGTSWADAYTDLQSAIDAALVSDTIFVAAGTYQPASSGQSFTMKEGVKIFGGFAGTETALSERNLVNNISTLQGNGNSVIRNDNNSLSSAAVLNGFTITGGNANNGTGGGMMNSNASPAIINCIFSGNSADLGGYGGGIYNGNSSFPIITNCIFSGNSADYGGGMYNDLSGPTITNSTFSGNNASTDGGSIYNYNFSTASVRNSILWGNSSGIVSQASSSTAVTFSITETVTAGDGNLNTDPQFVNATAATSAPFTGGDYHVQSCSPAINAGTNEVYAPMQPIDLTADTSDLSGFTRIQLGKTDIGAYESNVTADTASIAADNIVVDNIQSPAAITYYGNHCNELVVAVEGNGVNPVNGNTTVKVWIETIQPANFVKRHYEITPGNGTTGRITLYFTQNEFDDFNTINSAKLPQDASDNAGIGNIRIEKRGGTSNDNTGLPGSYTSSAPVEIPNNQLQVTWNAAASRWEISFDVTGFSGFFVKTTGSILPLRLVDFKVKEKNCTATVEWTTAEETNVAGFEIQESSDGIVFMTINTVSARNTSGPNKYNAILPVTRTKTYYRLKMIDIDGTATYSNVKFVTAICSKTTTVYPNPAYDKIFIRSEATGSDYSVYDNAGKKVGGGRIDKTVKEINITNFASGVFYVVIEGKSYKIIKNHK